MIFPDSNLQAAKLRPALIVQADHLQTGLPQVIVAMITSNLKRGGHLSRVLVQSILSMPELCFIGDKYGRHNTRTASQTSDGHFCPS